ncbi:hypothetical protein AB1Y20_018146 [Prymnesium parvum]|uniref:RING-type domain-containing protein n=1 Tax=Prymnesium parvum TaxID=97485 RepID=A0AB34JR20_PRYPA
MLDVSPPVHLFVWDEDPQEPILDTNLSDFWVIILSWSILGWGMRLCYIGLQLLELRNAAYSNRAAIHHEVALHSEIGLLDFQSRSRFLAYLRSRTPATPAATVNAFKNPVAVRNAKLQRDTERTDDEWQLELEVDCTAPSVLQLFWGCNERAVEGCKVEEPRQKGTSHGLPARGATPGEQRQTNGTAARNRANRFSFSNGFRAHLGGVMRSSATVPPQSQPVVHQLSAIELGQLPANQREPRSSASSSTSFSMTAGTYLHSSKPHSVAAGIAMRITLKGADLPPASELVRALNCETPLLLAFYQFGAEEFAPELASADGNGAADEDGEPVVLPTAMSSSPESSVLCALQLLRFAREPAATAAAPADSGDTVEAPAQPDGETTPGAAAPQAGGGVDEISGDEDLTGSRRHERGGSVSDASDVPAAVPATPAPPPGPPPGFFDSNLPDVLVASLHSQLVMTPQTTVQVMDIFGVSDYVSSPECIACLTEPRDTILLPCRHLCVCSDCFERLTLDRCPVCRAPFQSYLRFISPERTAPNPNDEPMVISAASDPASNPSEAPSTEPFLPPEANSSSQQSAASHMEALARSSTASSCVRHSAMVTAQV